MATRRPAPRPGQPGQGPGSNGGGEDGVNIQVVVRCRPLSKEETASRAPCVVKCTDALREVTLQQNIGGKQIGRTYHFDRVLSGETTQEELYQRTVSPMVDEMLEGFNCTIFAYGQTGTGKTYTMNGEFGDELGGGAPGPHSGVVPRAIYQVFAYLDALGNGAEFTVKASYLELYNEEITDLLVNGSGGGAAPGPGNAAAAPSSSGAPPGAPESRIRILE
ncbi:kinesin, partial [Helicosporidium sp. ATCC 50920]